MNAASFSLKVTRAEDMRRAAMPCVPRSSVFPGSIRTNHSSFSETQHLVYAVSLVLDLLISVLIDINYCSVIEKDIIFSVTVEMVHLTGFNAYINLALQSKTR